jgi:hypothetical protein
MRARLARLAFLSALVVVAVCVAGYLMSGPTDAASAGRFGRPSPQPHALPLFDTQATLAGRERPSQRPQRSDYDAPDRRVRASSLEALLQRQEAGAD